MGGENSLLVKYLSSFRVRVPEGLRFDYSALRAAQLRLPQLLWEPIFFE